MLSSNGTAPALRGGPSSNTAPALRGGASVWVSLLAGLALASLEVGLVLSTERALFLSSVELARYAAFALCALPALCLVLGLSSAWIVRELGRGVARGGPLHLRRVMVVVTAVAWPALSIALLALTTGRRLRALPARTVWMVLLAGVLAFATAWIVRQLLRALMQPAQARLWAVVAIGAAALALTVDMYALRRLYPALHWSLSAVASASMLCGVALWVQHAPPRRFQRGLWVAGVALLVGAFGIGASLQHAPNARFAIELCAPLSGKLLQLQGAALARAQRPEPIAQPVKPAAQSTTQHAGIDLRGKDVLLITVDALRADRVGAYGSTLGLTPRIDALASDGAVFTRAYTPTPHTSYAVTSMLTGKFMQPLLSLSEHPGEHPTLPEILRQHGYRTAAFYPPAIFFVDEEHFGSFASRQLGFEYVKAMFDPVDHQVAEVQRYLAGVDQGYPVFAWVHVFEPHEPYDPPPEFARGESPRERYHGEIAAADAGVGDLVAAFRKLRPNATVILTSDHGEEFGDHGGQYHGTTMFDEQVRVPLVWSSPGTVQPRAIDAPVDLIDLTTTLLSALGIPREARMRGDDLGALLAGEAPVTTHYAFSMIESLRMVTDGREKLICGAQRCQLFDLREDRGEHHDLQLKRPERVTALRAVLSELIASLPRMEALAMEGGGGWPEALARARLGDASAAPEVVPLLSSARAEVRAAAARVLGELNALGARNVIDGLRERDADPAVRAEAALAALRLGQAQAAAQVETLLAEKGELGLRAALALAAAGVPSGAATLLAAASDEGLEEQQRLDALDALAKVGDASSVQALRALLPSVRLRPTVARVLGAIGGKKAVPILIAALRTERYPEARAQEAAALIALGAHRPAVEQVRRFLGTDSSLPNGVELLLQARALGAPSGAGADLRVSSSVQRGAWSCGEHGCRPAAGAELALPSAGAPRSAARVTLRAFVEGGGRSLRVAGERFVLDAGAREIGLAAPELRPMSWIIEAEEGIWLQGVAVVPVTKDVPPPAPEPWEADAGVEGE